jgi:hypothetical protein
VGSAPFAILKLPTKRKKKNNINEEYNLPASPPPPPGGIHYSFELFYSFFHVSISSVDNAVSQQVGEWTVCICMLGS